ncbi:E3 ubiquitin-protein ligase TRIM47-like [Erpetoichthys calabaricus]|uniref:E3 ubiquitin-protein ligase TRIM47-like n=1 Tax=Erpetoichthys calabaricus TaxID=27687 RepID=UPI00109F152F|nr:E3 ubiquitin-protein ligase TRIM47-like [Erpetoichthys calabaricus]
MEPNEEVSTPASPKSEKLDCTSPESVENKDLSETLSKVQEECSRMGIAGSAYVGTPLSDDHFTCPICLDLYVNIVSIPCGHNYCKSCVEIYWKERNIFTCPVCKARFFRRPNLNVNKGFSEIVEEFKKRRSLFPEKNLAGQGDVGCDVCTGIKFKALKSCLVCVTSYCEDHIRHHEKEALKWHTLVSPVKNPQEWLCKLHKRPLMFFCKTDQVCICRICNEYVHQGHETVAADVEWRQRKKQIGNLQTIIRKRQVAGMKKIAELNGDLLSIKDSALAEANKHLEESLRAIERARAEILARIEVKRKEQEDRAGEFIEKIEQDIVELEKKKTEFEKLLEAEDHISFLQNFKFDYKLPEDRDLSIMKLNKSIFKGIGKDGPFTGGF